MEIRQLKTFKKVAELRSFSKASKELNYGQSTVTDHIKLLENEIGAPLFNRLGKTITITSVGEELYEYVIELLETHNKIKNISANNKMLNGQIKIGASESIIVYRLQNILFKFKELYPNVNISLISDNCSKLKEKLYSGEVDLIITLEPKINSRDLITTVIDSQELVFISNIEKNIDNIHENNKEQIENECIIFTDRDCAIRAYLKNYLYNKDINIKNSLEFSSMEAIKQCVVSNLGISLLPKICVETLITDKKIKIIDTDEEIKFLVQLSYHKNKWISPIIENFINILSEQII